MLNRLVRMSLRASYPTDGGCQLNFDVPSLETGLLTSITSVSVIITVRGFILMLRALTPVLPIVPGNVK